VLSAVVARWLLILHAVLAVALVGAATHWLVWLVRLVRGQPGRIRSVRRFAIIAMVLYAATMIVGLVVYPTYKARVKLEFLAWPAMTSADARARLTAAEELAARVEGRPVREPGPTALTELEREASERSMKIARWFDVKEHWVAVGAVLGLAALAVLAVWEPRRDGRGPGGFALAAVGGTAAIAWLAAIIGLVTTATRSF
jgi:hypothetical protein